MLRVRESEARALFEEIKLLQDQILVEGWWRPGVEVSRADERVEKYLEQAERFVRIFRDTKKLFPGDRVSAEPFPCIKT